MTCRLPVSHRLALPPAPVLGLALLAVVLRLGLALKTNFTQEDFLITLRYAENIAHGRGFVYNPGERVLGTTTPLYTLLLAGLTALRLPAPLCGKALNILADGALCLVVFRWLALAGQETAGYLAAFLIAVNPIQMRVAISGQESSLVALCGALVWLWYVERRYAAAYVTAAVLFLLRWDSLLLTFVMTGAILIRDRSLPWRAMSVSLLICLPWLVFATLYFGSPIPVTLAAKATVYGWYFRGEPVPELGRLLFRLWGTPSYLLMAAAAAIGLWRVSRERCLFLLPPFAWFVIYWGAFLVSKVWLFEWYLVPTLFVYEAFVAVGIAELCPFLRTHLPKPLYLTTGLAVALGLCVVNVRETLAFTQASQNLENHLRQPLGLWLRAHCRPTDHVMLEPIGYIGYYSGLPILDVTGLVTPGVLRYYAPSSVSPFRKIADAYRPDWCVLRPDEVAMMHQGLSAKERPWESDYTLVATFTYRHQPTDPPATFFVYRRTGNP